MASRPSSSQSSSDRIEQAAEAIRAGEAPEDVLALLEDGLSEDEDDSRLWYHVGYARLQAGKTAAGAEALERSLSLEEEANGYLYLGYARIELGELDAAREALSRCLSLGGPEQARYELAYACHLGGRHEDAAKHARKYVTNEPDDPDGWELYDAVCQKLERPRSFKRLLGRYGDDAVVELLEGRDAFSMGEPPFPVPFTGVAEDPAGSGDVKLDFLATVGGAYLGTATDDGLACHSYRRRGLSARDAGVMLVRLGGVLAAARIRLAGVLPATEDDHAVAEAAATILDAPVVAPEALQDLDPSATGRFLWLQAIGHDWLTYRRQTAARDARLLTAVLALDWFQAGLPFTPRFTPDVTGFIALAVPGLEGATGAVTFRDRAIDAARAVPDDEDQQQRHFYRSQPGLRFR